METFFKNTIIKQAIELGFDLEQFTPDTEIEGIEWEMRDFFIENSDKLESIEDECEVTAHGRSQNVTYRDYQSDGEIVHFSDHWHKSPDTKIYHSCFIIEDNGVIKNMNLYYLVGETEYNAPEGYYYNQKEKAHVKIED